MFSQVSCKGGARPVSLVSVDLFFVLALPTHLCFMVTRQNWDILHHSFDEEPTDNIDLRGEISCFIPTHKASGDVETLSGGNQMAGR